MAVSEIGLVGLAVMGQVRCPAYPTPPARLRAPTERDTVPLRRGPTAAPHAPRCPQNLSLNVAEKGFPISVYNRSYDKTEAAVARAQKEGARRARGTPPGAAGLGPAPAVALRRGRARAAAARVARGASCCAAGGAPRRLSQRIGGCAWRSGRAARCSCRPNLARGT